MSEEKRTFELSTQAMQGRLQPVKSPARARIDQQEPMPFSTPRAGSSPTSLGGFAISREMILRLIDWLKEE